MTMTHNTKIYPPDRRTTFSSGTEPPTTKRANFLLPRALRTSED
jgi:hypothetical protein